MAKKKKELMEVKEAIQVEPQEPERKFLTKEELLGFELFEARLEMLKAKADMLLIKRELYLKEVDPNGIFHKMGDDIKKNNSAVGELKEKHEAFRKQIQERLGVNLKDYAFDDETGLLNFVADQ